MTDIVNITESISYEDIGLGALNSLCKGQPWGLLVP